MDSTVVQKHVSCCRFFRVRTSAHEMHELNEPATTSYGLDDRHQRISF